MTEVLGLLAATFTTIAFIPQVYKIWKEKASDGVSVTMYLVMLTGVLLWEVYGWLIHSLPVILANAITALLLIVILYLKLSQTKKE